MKPIHYLLIFAIGTILGWTIYEKQNPVRYDRPDVCEVLEKDHSYCK